MSRQARTRLLLAAAAAVCAGTLVACSGAGPAGSGPEASAPSVSMPPTTGSDASSPAPVTSATAPAPTSSASRIPWPPETSGTSGTSGTSAAPTGAPTAPPPPTSTTAPEWITPAEATVGACININRQLRITDPSFGVVPCTEFHDAQVVGHGILPEGFNRDAKGAYAQLMMSQCDAHFAAYTGTAFTESRLVSGGWAATKSEYAQGDRTLVCIISMRDRTKFSGDAKGKTDESEFGHAEGWTPPTQRGQGPPNTGQRA